MQNILISSDHKGLFLKSSIIEHAVHGGYNIVDCGTDSSESCDYPDYAHKLCKKISEGDLGILICHTGIGMSIVANRYESIRAALCRSESDAKMCRKHNDANILVLGSNNLSREEAKNILQIFINTPFEGGRHQNRIEKI
jgi:ribose 5-phosphate isomerase B